MTSKASVLADPKPNPDYVGTKNPGIFQDRIGPEDPPDKTHTFLKMEQTFTVLKDGQTYFLSTKINQYISVTDGKVTASAVVIVP